MNPANNDSASNAKEALVHGVPRKADRKILASAFVQFLFAPILLLLNLRGASTERHQRLLITLFFAAFGSTMLIGGDAIRHQWVVETFFSQLSFSAWLSDLWLILTFRTTVGGAHDVYNHTISYLFGGVLDLPQLYIPFVAAVYGYFYAGSVVHVLRNLRLSKLNYVLAGFVALFIFTKGLEGVQTVRTWTGMWVLVYGCLKYYETRRLRYLLLIFAPPFIHFGYWVMTIPAWIVLVYGSRPLLYTVLVALSSFTSFLPSQPVTELISQTERGAASLQWYQVEERQDAFDSFERQALDTNWYNAYRQAGIQRWAPIVLVLTLFLSGVYEQKMNGYQQRIFSVGVLTLAFSNMTWFVFAIHNRTLTIAMIFLLAGFLLARLDPENTQKFRRLPPYYQWGLHLALVLWIPLILFNVSVSFDRMSAFALVLPFLVWLDPELNIALKEVLNVLLGRA